MSRPPKQRLSNEELDEINKIVNASGSLPGKIITNPNYLYFVIQKTQEKVSVKQLVKSGNVQCFSVLNFKNSIIGYYIRMVRKPLVCPDDINGFGAAIIYNKALKYVPHKKVKLLFSDAKFRLISFDKKDYFASVKWKSNNPTE